MLVLVHGDSKRFVYADQCTQCGCKFAMDGEEMRKALTRAPRDKEPWQLDAWYHLQCPDCGHEYDREIGKIKKVLVGAGKETDRSAILFALREQEEEQSE